MKWNQTIAKPYKTKATQLSLIKAKNDLNSYFFVRSSDFPAFFYPQVSLLKGIQERIRKKINGKTPLHKAKGYTNNKVGPFYQSQKDSPLYSFDMEKSCPFFRLAQVWNISCSFAFNSMGKNSNEKKVKWKEMEKKL